MDKIDIFLERHKEQNYKEEIKTTITKNLNTSKSIKLNLKLTFPQKEEGKTPFRPSGFSRGFCQKFKEK